MSKFKKIVQCAFDRWENSDESYEDFLSSCSQEERFAIVLSNLEYQVASGGFKQWVNNGYTAEIPHLIESLRTIPGGLAQKVIELVERVQLDAPAHISGLGKQSLSDLDYLTELYDQFAADFLQQVEDHYESLVPT